ncbi:MAG: FKBP-type peptidyl-prolyl cis-trans isomerase [Bacteroidetes bacterium]|nr:FKBP-type peptidyl-prolyl cis-trans isomerase [Bacteroidota bacterium]
MGNKTLFAALLLLQLGFSDYAQFNLSDKDTVTTNSGLKYIILEEGDGYNVEMDKEVAFEWTGYLEDGSSFGTSVNAEPFFFITGKGQVIKGAEEGLALMREGDRYLFIMPPELAYGEKGAGDVIPPNSTLIFNYKVLSVTEPKLSIADTMSAVIKSAGIEESLRVYRHLKNTAMQKFAFRESELNRLGYMLMGEGMLDESVKILSLNVSEYPDSWNVYDSLGEALMNAGEKMESMKMFEKSLELNPDNASGRKNLQKLRNSNK